MIDLHAGKSSNSQRVSIVLEECGLPYRVHRYSLMDGEHKTPAFAALNPAGMVPVIVDDDGPGGSPITLTQSGAIAVYLAEKAGRFVPRDALARTRVLEWMAFTTSDIVGASAGIFVNTAILPDRSPANVAFYEERLLRYLRVADARLAGREWLADELSVADFSLYPVVAVRASLIERSDGMTHLERWRDELAARPAVDRGMKAFD
ncbi:MAG TPA: glutathione S-transferase family protein [Casimicrobiaceae bacterium]